MVPAVAPRETAPLADQFRALAKRWQDETALLSSTSAMIAHPAYRAIIGLGWDVVPLLLEDLQREPQHWFEALRAITGDDPVPRPHWGDILTMRDDWLAWGRSRGLI